MATSIDSALVLAKQMCSNLALAVGGHTAQANQTVISIDSDGQTKIGMDSRAKAEPGLSQTSAV